MPDTIRVWIPTDQQFAGDGVEVVPPLADGSGGTLASRRAAVPGRAGERELDGRGPADIGERGREQRMIVAHLREQYFGTRTVRVRAVERDSGAAGDAEDGTAAIFVNAGPRAATAFVAVDQAGSPLFSFAKSVDF